MTSEASRKLLEKVSASQYALLRSLTDRETLDARWLDNAVASVVKDRFALARGFIKAARLLAKDRNPGIRRGAVSRAYYGAYHAARAYYFAIKRQDESDHKELSRKVHDLTGKTHDVGNILNELRHLREEADYSPYPTPIGQPTFAAGEFEGIIKVSIRRAEDLVALFTKLERERR